MSILTTDVAVRATRRRLWRTEAWAYTAVLTLLRWRAWSAWAIVVGRMASNVDEEGRRLKARDRRG